MKCPFSVVLCQTHCHPEESRQAPRPQRPDIHQREVSRLLLPRRDPWSLHRRPTPPDRAAPRVVGEIGSSGPASPHGSGFFDWADSPPVGAEFSGPTTPAIPPVSRRPARDRGLAQHPVEASQKNWRAPERQKLLSRRPQSEARAPAERPVARQAGGDRVLSTPQLLLASGRRRKQPPEPALDTERRARRARARERPPDSSGTLRTAQSLVPHTPHRRRERKTVPSVARPRQCSPAQTDGAGEVSPATQMTGWTHSGGAGLWTSAG